MLASSSSSSLHTRRGKLNKPSFLLLIVVLIFVLDSVYSAGLPCTTNSQCRRNTCILNACGPRSLGGGSCDENADCFNPTDLCITTKCLPPSGLGGPCDDFSDCLGTTDYCAPTTNKCAVLPPFLVWEGNRASPSAFSYAAGAVVDGKLYSFGGEEQGAVTDKVNIYDPSSNSWSTGKPMPGGGRRYHSATAVGSIIYIICGSGEESSFDTVLAYDTVGDIWLDSSSFDVAPNGPIILHATVLIGDEILVIGGADEFFTSLDTILSFSTTTKQWTDYSALDPSVVLPAPTANARAVTMGTDVYVTGGTDGSTTSDSVVLISTNSSPFLVLTLTVKLLVGRQGHGMFVNQARDIVVLGGSRASDGLEEPTVEVLDVVSTPGAESVSALPQLAPYPRINFVYGIIDDIFYSAGGTDQFGTIQITDAIQTFTFVWLPFEASPTPISDGAARFIDSVVITTGGKKQDYSINDKTEQYDPVGDTWLPGPFSPIENAVYNAVSAAIGVDLYVIGGTTDGSDAVNFNQKYNYEGDSWSQVSPMTNPRQAACGAVYQTSIFLFGGYDGSNAFTDTTQVYHANNNTWEQLNRPLPKGKNVFCSAATLGDTIYVFGGFSDVDGVLDSIQAFNVLTRTWDTTTSFPSLTIARSGISAVTLQDFIYIIGGTLDGVSGFDLVELFDPVSNTLVVDSPMPTPRFGHFANNVGVSIVVTGGFNNFNIAPVELFRPN